MKKTKITMLILVVTISIVLIYKNLQNSSLVYNKIIKYNNEMKASEIREINLHDYTSFEWDTVIIYNNLMSNNEISYYLGYNHDKYYDISSGWIFLKNNMIVYEEDFPPDRFPIKEIRTFYLYTKDIKENKGKFAIKKDGVFLLEKMYIDNEYAYRLFE